MKIKVELDYVQQFLDRHHRPRFYFRRKGYKLMPLPGLPGSSEFMAVYTPLLNAPKQTNVAYMPNSLHAVVTHFKSDARSAWNVKYKASTKRNYNSVLDELCRNYGTGLLADFTPDHVRHIRNTIGKDRTSIGDLAVTLISVLWNHAAELMEMKLGHNPALSVKKLHETQYSHPIWPDEWIGKFEAVAPNKLQVAVQMGVEFGQRRGDIHRVMWSQYDGEGFRFDRQEKRKKNDLSPDSRTIPVSDKLKALLDAMARTNEFIINSNRGGPYTKDGLSEAVRSVLDKIGAPKELVFHGLRKTSLKTYADAGANNDEMKAISGHRDDTVLNLYKQQADQTQAARRAVEKLRLSRAKAG